MDLKDDTRDSPCKGLRADREPLGPRTIPQPSGSPKTCRADARPCRWSPAMDTPIAEEMIEGACQAGSVSRLHPGGPACPGPAGMSERGPAARSRFQITQFLAET